jgi:hypothetical protein
MILKVSSNDILNPSSISISGGAYWSLIEQNYSTANGNSAVHIAWYWAIWHTGDASSWTATIGVDIRDDESYVQRVTGAHPTAPIGAEGASISFGSSVSPISPTVTTTADNSAVIFDVGGRNGNNLTAENTGNPSGTTLIQSKRTRANSSALCSGIAYELRPTTGATGTRTWTNYFNTSSVWSAFSFEILPAPPAYSITTVNSGNPVKIGSTVSFTKTGFTKAITKGTLDGVALTSATDTTFTVPNLVDGAQLPRIGLSRTLFLSSADDTETATINIEVANPDGWASTVIETGFSTGELDSIDYNFSPPLAVDDIIFYDSTKGTVFPDAGYEGAYDGTQTLWHHDESTKTVYSFNLLTGSQSIGLTAIGLTQVGLTQAGLTAVGL